EDGILAVVGGTGVFALFLSIGYDAFFLSRTLASIPRGRPVFPGVGNGVAVEEPFKQHGLVLRDTRMLDPASGTGVQGWGPQRCARKGRGGRRARGSAGGEPAGAGGRGRTLPLRGRDQAVDREGPGRADLTRGPRA